jgi:hypothetical protein
MREYALPAAGVLLNLALTLSIAKDWTKRFPDWMVAVVWVLSLVPLGYWLWTHPRIFTFLRTRYAASITLIVLLGALCGGGLAGMAYAFWYHSRTQTATTPPGAKPREEASDQKNEDKKKEGDKKGTATDKAQHKAPPEAQEKKQSATPSVPAQQPTFSVTNPSGSVINQGSTINAPQTVNNGPPPPQFELATVRESVKITENQYLTEFRLVVKAEQAVPYLFLRAEASTISDRILFMPDKSGFSAVRQRNKQFQPESGFASTNVEGVAQGAYKIKVLTSQPEKVVLTYDPTLHN